MSGPWKDARTVADLGVLMAGWLEGRTRTWPGYCDTKPAPETRHLIPALVAANRAGFVTTNSQPGHAPARGFDGRMWRQRAAVDGWVADSGILDRIRTHAHRAGITVITNRPGVRSHPGMVATEADGESCTVFGWSPGHRRLIALEWPGVGSKAVRELRTATHLVLIDPDWGRDNLLWPTLTNAIG